MRKRFTVREAKYIDTRFIAKDLKDDDLIELSALGLGNQIFDSVEASFINSTESYVMCADDRPFMIYGAKKLLEQDKAALVWMLATNESGHYKIALTKEIMRFIAYLSTTYDRFGNFVFKENKKTIKWLTFLGFHFIPEHEVKNEVTKAEFIPFLYEV